MPWSLGPKWRARLEIAAIFGAVGLGALIVTLVHDPMALVPKPPYGTWIFVRALQLASLASLGMLCVLGLEDDLDVFDESDRSRDRAIAWRAVVIAFLMSALASATFIAVSALVDHLDRILTPA